MPTPSRRAILAGTTAALAASLGGCGSLIPRNGLATSALQNRATIAGMPGIRFWGDDPSPPLSAMEQKFLPAVGRGAEGRAQVNVLALSGGGTDGAYGAGFLAGWTARRARPEFQIVTGVSAGAIIAPLAFLGPRYDRALKEIWTETKLTDLVVILGISGILNGTAVADTAPLAAAIAKYVTPKFLREVAHEYSRGRLLLIGTTNLDAQRPVVWNMTAIASSGHPDALELFRKIVLASASIPALFPPVTIEVDVDGKTFEEMHVDGGTTRNVFVAPFPAAIQAYARQQGEAAPQRRVFLINNAKATPEPEVVTAQTLSIAGRAIYTLLKSHNNDEVAMIYQRAAQAGAEFRMTAVPDSFTMPDAPLADPAYEKALYELGYRQGSSPDPWLRKPPNLRGKGL